MSDRLYIIDAIGPFFPPERLRPGETVNWSKVPFALLETGGVNTPGTFARIYDRFDRFCARVATLGYNAISIDDLAHLTVFPDYPQPLKVKLAAYQTLYDRLMVAAAVRNLAVFVNTDIMFRCGNLASGVPDDHTANIRVLNAAVRQLFRRFPHVAGVIVRLGESDGIDVQGDFRSELVIRTPRQARRYVRGMLPVFERAEKLLIVRTWTVGAYAIGDLMWNPRTFRAVFGGLGGKSLVASLKYGDSDFYRYLELNPLFNETGVRKIVELQARREYEGFGEIPNFIGCQYQRIRDGLSSNPTIAGIHVWCQTGGWSRFHNITFLDRSSMWNELNTVAALRLFTTRATAADVVTDFCRERFPGVDPRSFRNLIDGAELVMDRLWYLPEFSRQAIYFRRLRIPPLLWIFWDTIIMNHTLKRMLRRLVRDRDRAVLQGYETLALIDNLRSTALGLGIEARTWDFYRETCGLVALTREYFFGEWTPALQRRIEERVGWYERTYPDGFVIERDFAPVRMRRSFVKAALRLVLRTRPSYRAVDILFLIRFTGLLYPLVKLWGGRRLPRFARRQAMGLRVLFK